MHVGTLRHQTTGCAANDDAQIAGRGLSLDRAGDHVGGEFQPERDRPAGFAARIAVAGAVVDNFLAVHRHYTTATERARPETPVTPGEVYPIAIVPINDLTQVHLQALALARRLTDHVVAVFISDDPEKIASIRQKWKMWGGPVPLEVIESPYRSLVAPFLQYLDAVEAQNPDATVMVVLPELVYSRWWHQFLHNQTALRLKAALLFRPGTVVINVPYHLQEKRPLTENATTISR